MFNIYSVEETCSDRLGVTHRPTFKIMTLLKSSKPELRDRGALMTRCLQTWKVDLKFGRSSKSLFIETPTRRHQKADCFFSVKQNARFMFKGPKASKGYKGLKADNFHCPSRIFWCLLRSSAVDAVRTINPEEPPMSPPGRWEMVMKWRFTTEVSNIGCMMFRKFYIYSILVSVSVQDAYQPHISHVWVLATTILDSLALSIYQDSSQKYEGIWMGPWARIVWKGGFAGKAETIKRKMMPHANPLPRRGTTPPYHVGVNCPFGTSTEGISVNLQSFSCSTTSLLGFAWTFHDFMTMTNLQNRKLLKKLSAGPWR